MEGQSARPSQLRSLLRHQTSSRAPTANNKLALSTVVIRLAYDRLEDAHTHTCNLIADSLTPKSARIADLEKQVSALRNDNNKLNADKMTLLQARSDLQQRLLDQATPSANITSHLADPPMPPLPQPDRFRTHHIPSSLIPYADAPCYIQFRIPSTPSPLLLGKTRSAKRRLSK